MASKQGSTRPAAAGEEVDPKCEWQENATSYVIRLHLTSFRKEDFRVQVDGAGRLTVRGQRAAGGKQYILNKVFQLPANANLDDISGRFEAGVLTITVPKRPAAPPATVEEIIKGPSKEAGDDAKPKVADEAKKPRDEAKKQAERKEEMKKPQDDAKPKEDGKKKAELAKEEVDAKRRKQEPQEKKAAPPPPPAVRNEEDKPKAEAAAGAPTEKKQAPPEANAVDRESLAERVRRRLAEEEKEKAVAAAAEEAERERRQTAACNGWKERVAEELEGLTSSEWAGSLVETVKKNKEVIVAAAAVAAFSIGLFVSRKLFSRN